MLRLGSGRSFFYPLISSRVVSVPRWLKAGRCFTTKTQVPSKNDDSETAVKSEDIKEPLTRENAPGKLRMFIRQYGAVGVGVYGGVYVSTLGLLYGVISSGVFSAGDAISLIKGTGLDAYVDMSQVRPKTGDLAVAWVLTKFTEPLRLGLSVSITPAIARYVGMAPPKE